MPTLPSIDEITETFEFLGDWEERFAYLIDLGKKLPPMDERDIVDANRVSGCQASVWMKIDLDESTTPTRLSMNATSDAHIVNGLIAILLSLYAGKPVDQLGSVDPDGVLKTLELEDHLSPTRRNGLHAMISRIRAMTRNLS